jgi:hypothetical protein
MTLPVFLLAFAISAFMPEPQDGKEWLYAQTGNGLQIYDPETEAHLQSSYFPSLVNSRGLVYDSGRLYMMNQNGVFLRDFMVELHPATSRYIEVGKTNFSLTAGYAGLMRDPVTDRYYVQANDTIYEADMSTGELTYHSQLQPNVAIITAIAINSLGETYGASPPSIYYPKAALYRLRLESGQLDRVGDLQPIPIQFVTLTFDSQDRLWGAGFGPASFREHRLYRIDLGTFELHATFPFAASFPNVSAIAFGPKPDVTTYCAPKPNSAGCTPTIGWKGHPSASAHFGFEVRATQVVPDSPGFLMLGFGGQASVPFQGGTLCVAEPTLRTTPQVSGAEAGCSAAWSLDVNTWLLGNHPLAPGDRFTCQWWGRDPGLIGPESSQLSDALEVVLLP